MSTLMDDVAYTVSCPKCKAKKSEPCAYVNDSFRSDYDTMTRRFTRILINPAGTPTKRPHNERTIKASAKAHAERRKAYWAEVSVPPAALFALRDFDLAEYTKLKDWLRSNGSILWHAPRPVMKQSMDISDRWYPR